MTGLIPTADEVARAIVAASRETGADPIAVASGENDTHRRPYPISRARAYAAKALAATFTGHWRTRIAGYVGARGLSRQSYFSALDQRLNTPAGDAWWDKAVLARVTAAIIDTSDIPETGDETAKVVDPPRSAPSERMQAIRTNAQAQAQPGVAPLKVGNLPPVDFRKLGKPEAPATRVKRVLGDLGPPPRTAVEEGLARGALEGRECRDLLAEAARNTAALPIPKVEGDD